MEPMGLRRFTKDQVSRMWRTRDVRAQSVRERVLGAS
jgi:hypothetical protein